jgi:hypothetical protein
MREVPTTLDWHIKAMTALDRVRAAEHRFSWSIGEDEAAALAAADELQAATRDAMEWLAATPCPDAKLWAHVARMLNACEELALTAQRMAASPVVDSEDARSHLRDLLAVVDHHSQALDTW